VKCPLLRRSDIERSLAKGVRKLYVAAAVERAMKIQVWVPEILAGDFRKFRLVPLMVTLGRV